MILVQTNDEWKKVNTLCVLTWRDRAKELGHDVKFINYMKHPESFIELLYRECYQNRSDFVIVFFDDLYCRKFEIPDYSSVQKLFEDCCPDVVRLDGRVLPSHEIAAAYDGVNFYKDKAARRYQFSTVGTAFSLHFLKKMIDKGLNTAWDLENLVEEGYLVYGVRNKNLNYKNMIVKGKLDLFAILQTQLCLSVHTSIIRMSNRLIKRLIQYFV